jgi:hypothetical protein
VFLLCQSYRPTQSQGTITVGILCATAGLGYSNWRAGASSLGFSYSGFAGLQLMFSKGFGLTVEGGYSDFTPDISAGFVFKF